MYQSENFSASDSPPITIPSPRNLTYTAPMSESPHPPVAPGATTGDHPVKTFTKLIEVALPLEKINEAAVREKSIRHGHPSTLHLWWARRPLAAARAVIFAQMVDDPSAHPDRFPTE